MTLCVVQTPGKKQMHSRIACASGLPFRPQFPKEFVVVSDTEMLVVDGASRLQIFEGKAASGLLKDVIDLADGTRTSQEVEACLSNIPAQYVKKALELLQRCGLFRDCANDEALCVDENQETRSFLRRFLDVKMSDRQAYGDLQDHPVAIISSKHPQTIMLKRLLEKTGLRAVSCVESEDLEKWLFTFNSSQFRPLIVSPCLGKEDGEFHAKLDEWCARHNLSWLRVVADIGRPYVDIGPLFNRQITSCFDCFASIHSRKHLEVFPSKQLGWADSSFWMAIAATEIVYLLSQIGHLLTGSEFRRFDVVTGDAQSLRAIRVPGCAKCRPLEVVDGTDARAADCPTAMALVYEDVVGVQIRGVKSAWQPNEFRKDRHISWESKRLVHCTQYPLEKKLPDRQDSLQPMSAPVAHEDSLTIAELGTVLKMTAGIRASSASGRSRRRWAATAGNLGSVEIAVAVYRVEGLPSGFYFYQAADHSLAFLERRGGTIEIDEFMQRAVHAVTDDLPDALLLFTGAFQRVAQKYKAFAYKLVNLDAGVAVSQLREIAKGMNIWSHIPRYWADDLIEDQLNLESMDEVPTAVCALARKAHNFQTIALSAESRLRKDSVAGANNYPGTTAKERVEALYRDGRMTENELRTATMTDDEMRSSILAASVDARPLLSRTIGTSTIHDVLANRTSVRKYSQCAIPIGSVLAMLEGAYNGDSSDWPHQQRPERVFSVLVLAFRVDGLDPGVYAYDPYKPALPRVRGALTSEEAENLFVERELASAPAVFWIVGDMSLSSTIYGSLAYRHLLLRAGAAANRLSIAAIAMGLGGCIVGGVVPGAARRYLSLDGYQQSSLLAFTAGFMNRL
jgi:SagB-type dehydrogenase family enzyme